MLNLLARQAESEARWLEVQSQVCVCARACVRVCVCEKEGEVHSEVVVCVCERESAHVRLHMEVIYLWKLIIPPYLPPSLPPVLPLSPLSPLSPHAVYSSNVLVGVRGLSPSPPLPLPLLSAGRLRVGGSNAATRT